MHRPPRGPGDPCLVGEVERCPYCDAPALVHHVTDLAAESPPGGPDRTGTYLLTHWWMPTEAHQWIVLRR